MESKDDKDKAVVTAEGIATKQETFFIVEYRYQKYVLVHKQI